MDVSMTARTSSVRVSGTEHHVGTVRTGSVRASSSAPVSTDSGRSVSRFTSTSASVVAPTTLGDASLLRAVRAGTVLRHCGETFSSKKPLERNYRKSFQTKHIDDFLSHDWYGPDPILPTPKPELTANLSGSAAKSHAYGYWCQFLCPIVFAVFFLFWQDMRTVVQLGTRRCFLDKFCIDQTHPERKAAGILGLAGFLRCSDRMVVLWTPRYFTRLWCTYEVASWLHLQKPLNSVLFMPLAHAQIILAYTAACWVGLIAFILGLFYFPDLYLVMVVVASSVGLTVGVHTARHSTNHLRTLGNQLLNFSVTCSECYCCSVEHVNPNGEEVPCDRQVVYTTIAEWFKDSRGHTVDVDAAIERFDVAVRTQFAPKVLRKAGPNQLSYKYVILAGFPYFWRAGDVIGSRDLSGVLMFNFAFMFCTMVFAAVPIWYRVAMQVTCWTDQLVGVLSNRIADICVSALLGVILVLLTLCIWTPLQIVASIEQVLPIILASVFYCVLAMGVFFRDLQSVYKSFRASRGSDGERDASPPPPANPVDSTDTASASDPGGLKQGMKQESTMTPADSTDDKGWQDGDSLYSI